MNANNPMPTKVKIKPDLFLMLFITAILLLFLVFNKKVNDGEIPYLFSYLAKKWKFQHIMDSDGDGYKDDVDPSPAVFNLPPVINCLLYTSPSPRDVEEDRKPSSA